MNMESQFPGFTKKEPVVYHAKIVIVFGPLLFFFFLPLFPFIEMYISALLISMANYIIMLL